MFGVASVSEMDMSIFMDLNFCDLECFLFFPESQRKRYETKAEPFPPSLLLYQPMKAEVMPKMGRPLKTASLNTLKVRSCSRFCPNLKVTG